MKSGDPAAKEENGEESNSGTSNGLSANLHQLPKQPQVAPQRYKKGVCKYYMNNFCVHVSEQIAVPVFGAGLIMREVLGVICACLVSACDR